MKKTSTHQTKQNDIKMAAKRSNAFTANKVKNRF